MNPLMYCSYNFDLQLLTVFSPVAATTPGGTTLTFTSDYFLNPYSGVPRTGFTIVTMDGGTGEIDSTVTAGITLSIMVTDWTTFSSMSISRVDTMTTVGEPSVGQIKFTVDLPIDANCRIDVVFPPDMPLTNQLTQLSSDGVLIADHVAPTFMDINARTFMLQGCDNYASYIDNALTMYYMKNKAHVMQTQSFTVYLWAIDAGVAYPIAK